MEIVSVSLEGEKVISFIFPELVVEISSGSVKVIVALPIVSNVDITVMSR